MSETPHLIILQLQFQLDLAVSSKLTIHFFCPILSRLIFCHCHIVQLFFSFYSFNLLLLFCINSLGSEVKKKSIIGLVLTMLCYQGSLSSQKRPERIYNSLTAMGCQQCLSLSVVQLKGKHCRKPHCNNWVVDMFGLGIHKT